MKRTWIYLIFILISAFSSRINSQPSSLWIPPQYQQVYEDSLHMYDGAPGPNYWQNRAEYDIQVEVNPATRMLTGQETITYYNESPDTLHEMVLRLHQNIYKRGAIRMHLVPDSIIHEGIQISNIHINGEQFNITSGENYEERGTIGIITLPEVVDPQHSLRLQLQWQVQMPVQGYRTGFIDATSGFIGYWYPQIAVYDAIRGWDQWPYTGYLELYQDYADFRVHITVPDSLVVWGTGVLQNPSDILTAQYLRRYHKAQRSSTPVRIADSAAFHGQRVLQQTGTHTWIFQADNVPDFAFALSHDFHWEGVSVPRGQSDETVFVQVAFPSDSTYFTRVAEWSQQAITYFVETFPGVRFPYPAVTLFDGRGALRYRAGMEFPMMINQLTQDLSASQDLSMVVTIHEIAHMYIPFLIGTDEIRYAWMDEGFATYVPWALEEQLRGEPFIHARNINRFKEYLRSNTNLPLITQSHQLGIQSYYRMSYQSAALAFLTLEDMLGKSRMRQGLQTFLDRWNGKHALPWDLFFTFHDVLGEDLSWFWRPWFYEAHIPDIGISAVDRTEETYWVTLENHGGLPGPVDLTVTYVDSTTADIHHTARIWEHGNSTYRFPFTADQDLLSVELMEKQMVDMDSTNNRFKLTAEEEQ